LRTKVGDRDDRAKAEPAAQPQLSIHRQVGLRSSPEPKTPADRAREADLAEASPEIAGARPAQHVSPPIVLVAFGALSGCLSCEKQHHKGATQLEQPRPQAGLELVKLRRVVAIRPLDRALH